MHFNFDLWKCNALQSTLWIPLSCITNKGFKCYQWDFLPTKTHTVFSYNCHTSTGDTFGVNFLHDKDNAKLETMHQKWRKTQSDTVTQLNCKFVHVRSTGELLAILWQNKISNNIFLRPEWVFKANSCSVLYTLTPEGANILLKKNPHWCSTVRVGGTTKILQQRMSHLKLTLFLLEIMIQANLSV